MLGAGWLGGGGRAAALPRCGLKRQPLNKAVGLTHKPLNNTCSWVLGHIHLPPTPPPTHAPILFCYRVHALMFGNNVKSAGELGVCPNQCGEIWCQILGLGSRN